KTGTGELTLSGDNTYSGGTTISDGTLIAASVNALGSGDIDNSGVLKV
ncbi:autotransporter-associated beta strand repeat-containing protein, partial [Salmonella enterica]